MNSLKVGAGSWARPFIFAALVFFPFAGLEAKSLELSNEPRQGLAFLNNGHVLEAYDLLRKYRKTNHEDVQGLFLLAMTKLRMMTLAPYNKSDRAELIAILDQIDGYTEPKMEADDNALFFLSASQGLRAQLTGMEGDWWATAKLGKRMRSTSLELIERNPQYHEAYYLLGSYNYLADALPNYIKFMRTLIFLPGGDRVGGIKQLIRAYEQGALASIESGRTLAYIYTFYEKRPDYGVQMCENLLATNPDGFDIGLYKGINLYYASSFAKAEEWFRKLQQEVLAYSRMNGGKENEVVPVYAPLERETRYWMARSMMLQEGKMGDAQKMLLSLKKPELHSPYWIQRGVFLSLAEIAYKNKQDAGAAELIQKVLKWQDVKDSHEKAELLLEKKSAISTFAIDFR